MIITTMGVILCIILTLKLIPLYHLAGAGAAMLISAIFLIIFNSFVNFESLDYINTKSIIKTCILTLCIGILTGIIITNSLESISLNYQILKPVLFLPVCYLILWKLKEKLIS